MLMHGSGLTHIVWSLHEQFYASQGYNVLSIDLPGHGSSEGPSLKSIEDMSSWVKSFMETLKIQKDYHRWSFARLFSWNRFCI